MNKSKLTYLTLLSLSSAIITPKHKNDETHFEYFVEEINQKIKSGVKTIAEWLEYYKHSSDQELTEWVEYCRSIAPEQAEAFKTFIINEKDIAFTQLNLAQQKAIRDLNQFYYTMTTATKDEQKELVKNFSARWKEIKNILKGENIENFKILKK